MQSSNTLLPCIEINPDRNPIGSVILLHGLGANGQDFVPFIKELHLPAALPLRFVFPNAPTRPVTVNNGYIMPAWYDILSLNINQRADLTGVGESVGEINRVIEHEIKRGIPADKIVLAGFSQGGVIALTTALRSNLKFAGVLALSTYLPGAQDLVAGTDGVNKQTPIFMAHGTQDPIVPFMVGQEGYDVLKADGFNVSWHVYSVGHHVCQQEIDDIAAWLKKIFHV